MLNQRPIFIVGFGRGGSSILLNILRSHPDVCSPRGETQQVFHGKPDENFHTRVTKLLRYAPVAIAQRQDVFSIRSLKPRRAFSAFSRRTIDRVLFDDKCQALGQTQNLFKSEAVKYSNDEILRSRLLCKNLNGLAFLTVEFAKMYPDATFFGLVRNGFAICESHIRRWGKPAHEVGALYKAVCERMIRDAEEYPNFHLVKYEDIVSDTAQASATVFELADLDKSLVEKFRLVINKGKGSTERTGGEATELQWYSWNEFAEVVTPKMNMEQVEYMSEHKEIRESFLESAGPSMKHFGYI